MKAFLAFLLLLVFYANNAFASNATANPFPAARQVTIINNTSGPIFPVLQGSPSQPDQWLQAFYAEPNPKTTNRKYNGVLTHVVYLGLFDTVNDVPLGIPAGKTLTVNVPFFSTLAANPDPTVNDQYIDWWNAGRVYIYDNADAVKASYIASKAEGADTLHSAGITCNDGESGNGRDNISCSTASLNLTAYHRALAPIPNEDPEQLTEYTFSEIDRKVPDGSPYKWSNKTVDYDVSYVDHAYLPIAMEPIHNEAIGYTGSVLSVDNFRGILKNFISKEKWAVYNSNYYVVNVNPKVPGAYNLLQGSIEHKVIPEDSVARTTLINNWKACRATDSNCKSVSDFFDKNFAKYTAGPCANKIPDRDDPRFLPYVYGFVPFNCPGFPNDLEDGTNSLEFRAMEAKYKTLMYYTTPFEFNPFVRFIHGPRSGGNLGMKGAYAFSIDDIVGNMQEEGDGVYIAVGGAEGLPNDEEFDPATLIRVNLGIKLNPTVTWASYRTCTGAVDKPLGVGVNNFQILSTDKAIKYPCQVTVTDSNGTPYQFFIKAPAPFVDKPAHDQYVDCAPNDTWCNGVDPNITGTGDQKKSFLNTQDPNKPPIPSDLVAPKIDSAERVTGTLENVALKYTQATGTTDAGFTYSYFVHVDDNWPFTGNVGDVVLQNVGLGKATIFVRAHYKKNGVDGHIDSDAVTVDAAGGSDIVPPEISPKDTYWLSGFSNTIVLTYSPASGGAGDYVYTYTVNGQPWDKIKPTSKPTQVLLNGINNRIPNTIIVTAMDSESVVVSSAAFVVPPK